MTVTRSARNPLLFLLRYFGFLIFFCVSVYAGTTTEKKIKSVINAYNNGIIQASKTSETLFLKKYASDRIIQKFHLWLKSWHDNNLFMDAQIKKIDFMDIAIKEQQATVTTKEYWLYKYINIKTKKEVLRQTPIYYHIKYTLLKRKKNWLIDHIDILSEKK